MTEVSGDGGQKPRNKAMGGKGLTLAILVAVGIGALAVLYVIVSASMKPRDEVSLQSLATGDMAKLEFTSQGKPAPSAEFMEANGRRTSLKAFEGQVTVVNMWATWCGPCREEMPTLARLQAEYRNRPLRVVAVSVDRAEDMAAAKAFMAQHGPLTFYQDAEFFAFPRSFDPVVFSLPTTVIYGRDGKELARMPGGAQWDGPNARAVIDWALTKGR
jgi:thiol-disulfide isomerase/thioredoxin